MGRMLGMLTLFFCCLLLSGFFSGSETALLSASRLRMQRLANEGDRPAALVLELTANPRRLLAGILVGNNIVSVLAAATATIFFTDRLGTASGVVVATVVSTVLLVLFAEFLPKSVAAISPINTARRVAQPIRLSLAALAPVVLPLEVLSRPLARWVGRKAPEAASAADLRMAVAEGVRSGAINEKMARVLRGGLSLTWKRVADVLVPRVDVRGVEASAGYEESLAAFKADRLSRLLVMEGGPDKELGYLAGKDLLHVPEAERSGWTARASAREALRVPGTMPLTELLPRMQEGGVHFAVVKDEHGGTEGIVTLEDVLEELVGEIRDEFDYEAAPLVREKAPGVWIVRADMSVPDVGERLGLKLEAEEARTIGGLLSERMGRVPDEGDAVQVGDVRLVAYRVSRRRVKQVLIEKRRKQPEK